MSTAGRVSWRDQSCRQVWLVARFQGIPVLTFAVHTVPSRRTPADVTQYTKMAPIEATLTLIVPLCDETSVLFGNAASAFFEDAGVSSLDALMARARRFSIDLLPRVLFSRSPMIDAVVRSGVNRYVDFKSVTTCYMWTDTGLVRVAFATHMHCSSFARRYHHQRLTCFATRRSRCCRSAR